MGFMQHIVRYSALMIILLSAPFGCSDNEFQAPKQAATDIKEPETKAPVEINFERGSQAVKTYGLAESFNVGENVYVRSLAVNTQGNTLLVGTSVGVVEVDLKTRNMLSTYTRDQGLANEYVFGMLVDRDGSKWFGTNGGGISKLDNNQWKTYFPMHGLADYWVYSFTQQSDGTLWVGTWAGLNKFDKSTETFTTYLDELVNEWVYGLDVDSKDQVWIGTEGGINMFDGQTWKTWTHKDGLGAENNENLPVNTNTGLGTRSRHDLSVMEMGTATYNPNYVFTLIIAKDDTLWANTWGGGVAHFDESSWVNYTKKDGLAGNIIYSIAQDDVGNFWFGTNNNLSRFDGNHWEIFTKSDGLLDNSVYAIAATQNNDIWVGSRSGVVLLQNKELQKK